MLSKRISKEGLSCPSWAPDPTPRTTLSRRETSSLAKMVLTARWHRMVSHSRITTCPARLAVAYWPASNCWWSPHSSLIALPTCLPAKRTASPDFTKPQSPKPLRPWSKVLVLPIRCPRWPATRVPARLSRVGELMSAHHNTSRWLRLALAFASRSLKIPARCERTPTPCQKCELTRGCIIWGDAKVRPPPETKCK